MKPVLILNKPHEVLLETLTKYQIPYEADYESSYERVKSKIKDFSGLVLRSRIALDADFIEHAQHLKFIAREGVGLDHIDTTACAQWNIPVLISPEGSKDTVAEHAIGMLLNLMNHLSRCNQQVKQNIWSREENRAFELKGKTIGIIGYGNMGRSFAQKIKGFDVEVLAYDKYKQDYGDDFASAVSLEELLNRAEVITLHIPLDAQNTYFVNDSFFAKLKRPVFLINTARGLVLETAALVKAIQRGEVLGAALDVLEYEDQSFDQLMDLDRLKEENKDYKFLVESDQVVLSPHIAGWSFESKKRHGEVLGMKILDIIAPKNLKGSTLA